MVGGTALDGQTDDLPGQGVGLFLVVELRLLNLGGRLVGHLGFQLTDEQVFGLFGGHTGNALQLGALLVLDGLDLLPGTLQGG